jgi:hypothetical protein
MNLGRYHSDIGRIAEGPCRYPEGQFSGAGIVTCAGGRTYFTCAWVLVNLLRRLGCELPIEVWYRGDQEMSDDMRRLLERTEGVRCMNAADHGPGCRLNGWEIKAYAIIHSRFEEVLFLDCDNVPTRDPSGLLDEEAYRRHGAVFWPDRWMGEGDPDHLRTLFPQAWEACDVEERDEPEFESGQMVVNKRRCWRALQLAMFLNEHSSFFYRWLLGDKDTFHMAWRRIGQPYAMPMFRPRQDPGDGPVLYQHDFKGRCLFQHRNQDKWDYDGGNIRIPGFQHEDLCLELVGRLQRQWDGVVRRYPDDFTRRERAAVERIVAQRLFRYAMNGSGLRLIEMKRTFQVGLGKGRWETAWDVEQRGRGVSLTLHNGKRKMCVLDQSGRATWQGRCLHFERAPISVEPIRRLSREQRAVAEQIRTLLGRRGGMGEEEAARIAAAPSFLYRRVGYHSRPMELGPDHTIARGAGQFERWWFVDAAVMPSRLSIWGEPGLTCSLTQHADGVWRGIWCRRQEMPVELIPGALAPDGSGSAYYSASPEHALPEADVSYYAPSLSRSEDGLRASYYGRASDRLDVVSRVPYYGNSSTEA